MFVIWRVNRGKSTVPLLRTVPLLLLPISTAIAGVKCDLKSYTTCNYYSSHSINGSKGYPISDLPPVQVQLAKTQLHSPLLPPFQSVPRWFPTRSTIPSVQPLRRLCTTGTDKTRTIKDVCWLVPNQLGYLRLFLGTAVLWLPYSYYILAAGMYFICHALDLVDGIIARRLNQTSQFGAVLDYTTDIMTHSVMLMAIASVVPSMILPLAVVMMVEITGCVVSMYLTAAGKYWKHTDSGTPAILQKVIVNENYTNFGRVMLMIYQAFWSLSWVYALNPTSYPVQVAWALLLPGALLNFYIHYCIAYEGIRKWKE